MSEAPFKIVTLINGHFVKQHEAKISVFDNALLYAEGLFEAFLAIDDRVVLIEEHLRRLYKGSRLLGLKIPVNKTRLKDWIYRTALRHPDHIKKVRLTITSGDSPKWAGVQGKQQVIVTASSHRLPDRPFKLFVSDYRLDQKSLFRRIKTLSYIIHAVSLKQALKKRCDDALLLNENDRISEITSANIFWVKKGRIYTPPLTSGCLEGVTRLIAIDELRKMGLKVYEIDKSLADLLKADEIFITSSLKLALGVSLIIHNDRKYPFKPGPVTAGLSRRLIELVRI
ncbi:MAG: aminotransferase class IV family protein [candidate division Zixibacteria bacterium]|nr:aminotransferase class IV family protein [candidate division Zixibacteria bacterium]